MSDVGLKHSISFVWTRGGIVESHALSSNTAAGLHELLVDVVADLMLVGWTPPRWWQRGRRGDTKPCAAVMKRAKAKVRGGARLDWA